MFIAKYEAKKSKLAGTLSGMSGTGVAEKERSPFRESFLEAWRCIAQGRYEAAGARFVQLQSRFPGSSDVAQGLAWARLLQGRVEEGRVLMTPVVGETMPHFWPVVRQIAEEATDAKNAGETIPRTAGEALLLSYAALRDENAEEAVRLTRLAESWLPGNGFVVANVATALGFAQKYDEAIALLHTVLQTFGTPAMWHNLGLCEFQRGNSAGAREAFHRSLALLPGYDVPLWALATLEWKAKHFGAAFQYARAAMKARKQIRERAKKEPQ